MPKQFIHCSDCQCRDPAGTPSKRDCALPTYQGDSFCDDGNNKATCDWDGGDCCAKANKYVKTDYCDDCTCQDPNHKGSKCIHHHIGDGFCDDVNNTPKCLYDGGDCCKNGHNNQFRYCHECKCIDKSHHKTLKCNGKCGSPKHKGDKFCDDDNNRCGCGWDGGDCCGHNGNQKQYDYCFKCRCLDKSFKKPDCAVKDYQGDGICDDKNNVSKCDWDGGDCCKTTSSDSKQFSSCTQCQCLQKK